MYNKEKIISTMHQIKQESDSIKPFVIICQPRRDIKEMPAQNLQGYDGLHLDMLGYSHAFCHIGGEKVDVARNYLIEQAIASGAKYLLFVGEDTVLPYDGFLKLLKVCENNPKSCAIGVYYIKCSSPMIMVKENDWIYPADVSRGKVFETWQAGMDAMLIPIALLQEMKDKEPDIPFTCIGFQIDDLPFIGEDNFFYHRLRQYGYSVLCNTDVQCLHMDLASGKYTASEDIKLEDYYTNIPITERLTMKDKQYIDKRWIDRLPEGGK